MIKKLKKKLTTENAIITQTHKVKILVIINCDELPKKSAYIS